MRRSIFFSFACIDLKFCKQPPDHCCIINHGLALNYKVHNCACADVSFLVLHILTWNFLHSFLLVPVTISQSWVCSFRTKICGNCTSTLLLLLLSSLALNYKVRNCACADLSFLVLHISTWNFLHSFLFVPVTISQAWVCSFRTKICGNCTSTLLLLLSSLRSRQRYHRA